MDVDALLARHEKVSAETETQLLRKLTEQGWDAGCWIRVPPESLVIATQGEMQQFLQGLSGRGGKREAVVDPFPNGRDHDPVEGTDPCYVVVSQRCDIVGLLKAEPLIELAPAHYCEVKGTIKTTWKNSPREFPLDPRAEATHVVDLRYRFYIPKLDLVDLPARQGLPADEPEYQVRQRFVLRTAQRYTRAAVPDHLSNVAKELKAILKGDDETNALFSEWAFFHGNRREDKPGLVAIYVSNIAEGLDRDQAAAEEDRIREAAENKFENILEALSDDAKAELDMDDDHRTRAVSETDYTVALWRLSWKLEWDDLSFTGDADAAIPAR